MMVIRFDHVSLLFFVFTCLLHSKIATAISVTDTMLYGDRISLSDNLVSSKGVFELGFFKPGSSGNNYYVGIWYKKVSKLSVVWIANRNYPVSGGTGVFMINGDGNLVISNGKFFYMVTNMTLSKGKGNTSVTLLDSGNLVLRDSENVMLWQSFDYPSHAFLPGMKLGFNRRTGAPMSMVSWRSSEDPGTGEFSLEADTNSGQFFIMKASEIYWTSGIWNGRIFSLIPEMRLNHVFNFSYTSNENESYFTYNLYNSSFISLLRIDVSGQTTQTTWIESSQQWAVFWAVPRDRCQVYAYCGPFSVCNLFTNPPCECLKGFKPFSSLEWRQGDMSSGCTREVPLLCENSTSNNEDGDKFLKMPYVRLPANSIQILVTSGDACSIACLSNCNCSAYAYNGSGGCSIWNEGLLNLQQLELGITYGDTIFVKLAASVLAGSRGNKTNKLLLLVIIPVVAFLLLGCCYSYQMRNKHKEKGNAEPGQDILLFDMSFNSQTTNQEMSNKNASAGGINNDSGLPFFTFVSVSTATDNFSAENKLGEGGFGPVYKGKLLKGHEIAVKRLSKKSGQGLEEFKNEAVLIAKLQHRNLVKLLGCSLEHDEKILIYEFMPNKSLDKFLFDPIKRGLLDWITRVRIVEGIAQGLLYLHQYSRLKIIHRDLKASNILLDAEMNPKISDFGMARIFGGNELQANTNRVVGTYGYMPPEYAMEGFFSVKTDVYSFGVLLLEIVSGKKNTGFYHSDSLNLLGFTWDLWKENRALDLKDPVWEAAAEEEMIKNIVMRYIHVALLCVQEMADDRPIMAEVVSMLTNESSLLSPPKQPAFSTTRALKTVDNAAINNPELSKPLVRLLGHNEQVTSLDFHPRKTNYLCSCDSNDEIRLWNINQSTCTRVFKGANRQVRFQPNTGDLLAGAQGNVINLIDIETGELQLDLKGHTKDIRSLCWDMSGKYIASVSEDSARIWSVASGNCIHGLYSDGNNFQSCTFHPGYLLMLVIGGYQNLQLWNPTESSKTMTVEAHEGFVAALADSPQNELIASASHDQWVKLWK